MSVTRIPLEIAPGIFKNGTTYQAKGRWSDGNLARFVGRTAQPVGGWDRALLDDLEVVPALTGKPRGAISWRSDSGETYLAFGTTCKLYILSAGVLYDITPAGFECDPDEAPVAGGYGSGAYGVGDYGSGASTVPFWEPKNWHLDTFGDYMLAMYSGDNRLFVWEGELTSPAVEATDSPSGTGVVVTPERFAVVFGAGGNVRRAEWASQETLDDWTPIVTNSAGGLEVASQGRIIAAKRTKNETLFWTDTDLHALQYIGGSLLYRFNQVGEHCGLVAPRAAATLDTAAIWMGTRSFFIYDGVVKKISSDVHDYVFGDFNEDKAALIWATTIAEFGEVWWFYPSAASDVPDRYVAYNYQEGHWSIGKLARAAGVDAGATARPAFIANTGEIYYHETGNTRSGGDAPYLESGPIEIGNGDRLFSLQRVIPDEKTLGDVRIKMYSSFDPNDIEVVTGPFDAVTPTDLRLQARQVRIRLDEASSSAWRIGVFRLAVRESARRGMPSTPYVAAPSNLVAVAERATKVNLTWTDNSVEETAVEVWRKTGAGAYALLDTLAAGSVSYSDTTTVTATTYTYKVRNLAVLDYSAFSNEDDVTTPALALYRTEAGLLFRDQFTRADGAPGSNWEAPVGSTLGDWDIVSNVLVHDNSNPGANPESRLALAAAAAAARTEVVAQAAVTVAAGSANVPGIFAKYDDTGSGSGYMFHLEKDTVNVRPRLYRVVNGVFTSISSNSPMSPGTFIIKLLAKPGVQNGWVTLTNGTLQASNPATDTVNDAVSGRGALRGYTTDIAAANPSFDDFALYKKNTITLTGMPAGHKLQFVDPYSGWSAASVVESGGSATMDLTFAPNPLTTIQLLRPDNTTLADLTPADGVWGGDAYIYG